MAITLPYEFDTMAFARNILKGFVAGCALMVLLALAMLVKYGPLAAVPFTLGTVFLAWVARRWMTLFAGRAKGTVTQDAVMIEPSTLGRIHLPSMAGRYPLGRFKAVRVTYRGPRRSGGGYLFAEVCLLGREGTADVCIAFERDRTAKALAPAIAAAVGLPLEQVGLAPFDH